MDDNVDIYADLDEFYVVEKKKADEQASSDKVVQDLRDENKDLKKQLKNIRNNFQAMLTTVRQEIKRKDEQLNEKRRIEDDRIFRRRAYLCSNCSRPLDVDIQYKDASQQTDINFLNQNFEKEGRVQISSKVNFTHLNIKEQESKSKNQYVEDMNSHNDYNNTYESYRHEHFYDGCASKERGGRSNKYFNDTSREDCRDKRVERSSLHNDRSHSNRLNTEYGGIAHFEQIPTAFSNQKTAKEGEKFNTKNYSAYSYLRDHESKNRDQFVARSSSHNDSNSKYQNDRHNHKYDDGPTKTSGVSSHKYAGDVSIEADCRDNKNIGNRFTETDSRSRKYVETHSRNPNNFSHQKYKFSLLTENESHNHKNYTNKPKDSSYIKSVRNSRKTISSMEDMQGRHHRYDSKTEVKATKGASSSKQRAQSVEKCKTEVRSSERLKQMNKIEYKNFDSIGEKIKTSKEDVLEESDKSVKTKTTSKKKDKKEIKHSNSEVNMLPKKVNKTKQSASTQNKSEINKQKLIEKNKRQNTDIGIVNPETLTVTSSKSSRECIDTNKNVPDVSKENSDLHSAEETSKNEKSQSATKCKESVISYETKSPDAEIVVNKAAIDESAQDSKSLGLIEASQKTSNNRIRECSEKHTEAVVESKLEEIPDHSKNPILNADNITTEKDLIMVSNNESAENISDNIDANRSTIDHNKDTIVNVDNNSTEERYNDLIVVSNNESVEIVINSIDTNKSRVDNSEDTVVNVANNSTEKQYNDLIVGSNNESVEIIIDSIDTNKSRVGHSEDTVVNVANNSKEKQYNDLIVVSNNESVEIIIDSIDTNKSRVDHSKHTVVNIDNNSTDNDLIIVSNNESREDVTDSIDNNKNKLDPNKDTIVNVDNKSTEKHNNSKIVLNNKSEEFITDNVNANKCEVDSINNNKIESEVLCQQPTELYSNSSGSKSNSNSITKQEIELQRNFENTIPHKTRKPKLKRKCVDNSNATVSGVAPKRRKCKNKNSHTPVDEIDKALNDMFNTESNPVSELSVTEDTNSQNQMGGDNKTSILQDEMNRDEEEMKEAIKSITTNNSNVDTTEYVEMQSNLVNTTPGVILDLNNYNVSIDSNMHLNPSLVVSAEQLNEYEVIDSFDCRTEIVQGDYNMENNETCIVPNSYESVIYLPIVTENNNHNIHFPENSVSNHHEMNDELIINNTELNNNINDNNKLVTEPAIQSLHNDKETSFIKCIVTDSGFVPNWNTSIDANSTNNSSLNESQKSSTGEAKHMKVGRHECVIESESPDVTTILIPGRKRRKRYPMK
ncbi:putative uncharacterized protein DDB_G0282133 [Teleopsis dalmanni]|uniref:putative uncharacterized protein DDB_G0282133 n=1 Tax=Teleopsis dalmanni TaxID=139649 RepID=UPI0018CD95C4|nr:putative uncharacterized protein DDB_G0282133 [Teleopsis dalmanni]